MNPADNTEVPFYDERSGRLSSAIGEAYVKKVDDTACTTKAYKRDYLSRLLKELGFDHEEVYARLIVFEEQAANDAYDALLSHV